MLLRIVQVSGRSSQLLGALKEFIYLIN